jgi:hypothetical protein
VLALIRTEGKDFDEGNTLTPEAFLALPDLKRASKTATTMAVEKDFDLGDCLYFFAGHACPDFGDVVLVYEGDMADADNGGATSFDTGGLHSDRIHYRTHAEESKASYCQRHSHPLSAWRSRAESFVQEHFSSTEDYVLGERPIRDDESQRLMHPDNSRRAWTWEIRLHRDHPIEGSLRRIWMSEDYYEGIRTSDAKSGRASVAPGVRLLDSGKVRSASADDLHRTAEKEVARWL